MRLKAFILVICAVIVSLMTGLFYVQANRIFEGKAKEIEAIHRAAVIHYASTLIEARKYLLTTFRQDIDRDNRLSKMLLIAEGDKRLGQVKAEVKHFQARTGCDIADLVYLNTASPLF